MQQVVRFCSPGWISMIQLSLQCVIPELLYDMNLEQRFSIEWFQSYMLVKLVQKITFRCITKYCIHIQHTTSTAFVSHKELSRHQKLS